MDFEFDAKTIGLTLIFYLLCMAGIWKIGGSKWETNMKITFSIFMLPLSYMMVVWQVNR